MSWLEGRGPRVVALAFAAYAALGAVAVLRDLLAARRLTDFMVVWGAAVVTLRDGAAASYHGPTLQELIRTELWPEIPVVWPWIYPPTALLLVLPLGWLGYGAAAATWVGAHVLGFLAAMSRWLPLRTLPLYVLLSPAVITNLGFAQNGLLTAACLGGGLALLEDRPLAAGAILALATYKPHLAIFVPVALLVGGQRHALAAFVAAFAAWAAATLAVFGPAAWWGWKDVVLGHVDWYQQASTVPFHLVTTPYGALQGLGWPGARVVQALVSLGGTAWLLARWRRAGCAEERTAVLLVGTALAGPKVVCYDLALLYPALAALLRLRPEPGPVLGLLLGLAWFLPWLHPVVVRHLGLPLAPLVLVGLAYSIPAGTTGTTRGGAGSEATAVIRDASKA